MGRYTEDIKAAKESIRKDGQKVIWRKFATVLIDPAKPWLGEIVTETEYQPYIAFVPQKMALAEALREMQGSVTKTGKVSGLMAAVDFVPDTRDVVVRGNVTYQISSIDELNINGESILFTIDFKG